MDQTLIVVLAVAAVAVLYALVRVLGTRVRSESGRDDVRGGRRRVRVSTVQRKGSMTVRTPDGQERTYGSLDEMPAELRSRIEEARRHGPTQTRIRVMRNGQTREYTSERDLPPDLRQRLDNIRAGGDGITIEVDGEIHRYDSPDDVPPHLRKFIRK